MLCVFRCLPGVCIVCGMLPGGISAHHHHRGISARAHGLSDMVYSDSDLVIYSQRQDSLPTHRDRQDSSISSDRYSRRQDSLPTHREVLTRQHSLPPHREVLTETGLELKLQSMVSSLLLLHHLLCSCPLRLQLSDESFKALQFFFTGFLHHGLPARSRWPAQTWAHNLRRCASHPLACCTADA